MHLGVDHVHAAHPDRYPRIPPDELRAKRPDLVVLTDERYRFTADDGPEAFTGLRWVPVSGRHLEWYGPSLRTAPEVLRAQLSDGLR